MAQICRQCDHVPSDPGSAWRAGPQCPYGKGMTEVVQARAMAARGGPKASFPQQRLERAMNRRIGQRSTMTADEYVIIASTEFMTAHQVALQPAAAVSCSGTRRVFRNLVSRISRPSSVMSANLSPSASETRSPVAASSAISVVYV